MTLRGRWGVGTTSSAHCGAAPPALGSASPPPRPSSHVLWMCLVGDTLLEGKDVSPKEGSTSPTLFLIVLPSAAEGELGAGLSLTSVSWGPPAAGAPAASLARALQAAGRSPRPPSLHRGCISCPAPCLLGRDLVPGPALADSGTKMSLLKRAGIREIPEEQSNGHRE